MNNINFISDEQEVKEDETEGYKYKYKRLWNPNSFIVLSIFFSFLLTSILYSLNYGRVGLTRKRNIFLIISISLLTILIALAFLPNSSGGIRSLFFIFNIGLGIYMNSTQKSLFKNHIEKGGQKASYLIPMIICIAVYSVLIFATLYSTNIPEQMKKVNNDELYYTKNISMQELDKLEDYLSHEVLANDNFRISAKIDKQSNFYILSFVYDQQMLNDPEIISYFKLLGENLSKDVFDNNLVEIHLCDDVFNTLKVIRY